MCPNEWKGDSTAMVRNLEDSLNSPKGELKNENPCQKSDHFSHTDLAFKLILFLKYASLYYS